MTLFSIGNLSRSLKYALIAVENLIFLTRVIAVNCSDVEEKMINFEEELKKFHPSLEVEDAEEAIYNQDLTDMADLMVKIVKESKKAGE